MLNEHIVTFPLIVILVETMSLFELSVFYFVSCSFVKIDSQPVGDIASTEEI